MIISKTPLRITLGGGGTDILWYSSLKGGAWISAALDIYIYIFINKFYENSLLKIYDGETIDTVKDIKKISNRIIRETLRFVRMKKGLEISVLSEVSTKSGLGGSGAFEVGLLNALHFYKKEKVTQLKLAAEACEIEINRLKYPVGPQDQYITALGGIKYFEIDKSGKIRIEPLKLTYAALMKLQNNLLFFKTGMKRETTKILGEQKKKLERKDQESQKLIESLDQIKELGLLVKKFLVKGKIDEVGASFHEHWNIKKKLATRVSNNKIDLWYDLAVKSGALGGKVMGAGGGGWMVFYVNKNKDRFISKMTKAGLTACPHIAFNYHGTRIHFSK